jgi:hypothetical protein
MEVARYGQAYKERIVPACDPDSPLERALARFAAAIAAKDGIEHAAGTAGAS